MEHDNLVWRQGQFLAQFDNGLTVSVITDGYGSEDGLFEAYVTSTDRTVGIPNLIPGGDSTGVYGWLTPTTLGQLLQNAAKAELRTVYVVD